MPYRFLWLAALALAGAATAQQRPSASESAKTFALDGLAPPAADAGASPTPAPTVASPAGPVSAPLPATAAPPVTATPPPAVRAVFTLDTPIADLIADPAAKAVLDKDLPGMSDDSNLDKFKELSLRGFQPLTGGQLTDAMLAKVASDLDAIVGGEAHITPPKTLGTSKRNKDDSR